MDDRERNQRAGDDGRRGEWIDDNTQLWSC